MYNLMGILGEMDDIATILGMEICYGNGHSESRFQSYFILADNQVVVWLDRGAWRALYRKSSIYGVTAGGGSSEHSSPSSDYEILSCRVGVCNENSRRVVVHASIGETGSGPDGSSLTPNY